MDSTIGQGGIDDDVNKLKEDVLKRGDNQDEGDGDDSVVDTWKGESNFKGEGKVEQ